MPHHTRTAAIALAAILAAPGLVAQEAQETQEGEGSIPAEVPLVATVGEVEITGTDVAEVIDTLPPQLRQQPLIPMAVDSLVLRELVVQDARAQGLAEDPEVQKLVEGAAGDVEDDALVQVYLSREIEERVTNEAVQGVYDDLAQGAEGELPPLEQVRPQIEQRLGQQALAELRDELGAEVEVVFYGPDGEPMDARGGAMGSGADQAAGEAPETPAEDGSAGTD